MYNPLNLKDGDILKANHLEHIEQGLLDASEKADNNDSDIVTLKADKADKSVVGNLSNPNLLINGDFQVWQRGESFSLTPTNNNVYTADRWCVLANTVKTVEKTDSGVRVSYGSLIQFLETRLKDGCSYTLSAKIDGVVRSLSFIGGTSVEDEYLFYTHDTTYDAVGIAGAVIYDTGFTVEWVKLEQGSIATPFVPRTYQEEWLLCQRYYQSNIRYVPIYYNYSSEIKVAVYYEYEYPMRTTPSMKQLSGGAYNQNGGWMVNNNSMRNSGTNTDLLCYIWFTESLSSNQSGILLTVVADAEIY